MLISFPIAVMCSYQNVGGGEMIFKNFAQISGKANEGHKKINFP